MLWIVQGKRDDLIMKVIKNLNNNASICVDNNGVELIAFGKGIGFMKPPYEIKDLSIIQKTYYGINQRFADLIVEIPEEILDISEYIVCLIQTRLDSTYNPNILFTLADHINFAITRHKKGMKIKYNFFHDMPYRYSKEVEIGETALKYIQKKTKIKLSSDEAYGIALHIINAETEKIDSFSMGMEKIVDDIIYIVEQQLQITINRNSFSFSRFFTHLVYLVERTRKGVGIKSDNVAILDALKEEYKEGYLCALRIGEYLNTKFRHPLSEEEVMYLVLHINRICAREDCIG